MKILCVALSLSLCSVLALAQDSVPTGTCVYQKLPLDNLLGPLGINDIGAIVGSMGSRAESTTLAFLLFKGKTTLFRFPGSEFSFASSINNHAEIVGTAGFSINSAGYVVRDGKFHLIVVPNSESNDAVDINDKGDIVGDVTTNDGVTKGYLLHNGTFHIFRFPGAAQTNVTGINRDGIIIGTYLASIFDARTAAGDIFFHGFMVKNGMFTTLDFPGAQNTFPNRINNEGEIIGSYLGPDGFDHGFSFQKGKFRALNDPPSRQESSPVGLNNHDQIVTVSRFPPASFIGDCRAAF